MMTEIAQNLCYSLELSDIVFFKPKEKFLLWLKNFKKSVIDCGAGTGYFGMEANKVGIKVLGIDLYDREKIYSPVLTPVDSTSYEFPKNTIALISRPNRGCWIHETFQNAINQNISLVYVGLKNILLMIYMIQI